MRQLRLLVVAALVGCAGESATGAVAQTDDTVDAACLTAEPSSLALTGGVTTGVFSVDNGCDFEIDLLDVLLDDPEDAFRVVDPDAVPGLLGAGEVLEVDVERVATDDADHAGRAVVRENGSHGPIALVVVELVGGP